MLATSNVPSPTTVNIPVAMIVVPDDKKFSFDMSDARNARFVENLDKVGLLEPVCVRPVGDEFELVYGRRRLWAARELKWEFIEAIVAEYSDAEAKLVTIIENVDRTQMTALEEVALVKEFNEQHERLFGPNPGRKISGRARAAGAVRDPLTQRFVSGLQPPSQRGLFDLPDDRDGFSASAPATTSGGDNGSGGGAETTGDVETASRSYVELAAGPLAKSPTQTRADAALASAFTKEQLSALGACNPLSKRGLAKLAKIKNAERRAEAVTLVCSGIEVADAIRQALGESAGSDDAENARVEENLSDEAWVTLNCEKLLRELQDSSHLTRAAILFRRTFQARSACGAKIRKIVEQFHNEDPNPFTRHLWGFLLVRHPGAWLPCGNCEGRNKDKPACTRCSGAGFQVTFDWPKRKP